MIQYLVLAGAAFSFTGAAAYIRDTLRGKTQPNRVTFGMWAVAPLIATVAALSRGVTWAAIPVFVSGFCPLMVFLSSFANKQAYWRLGKLDYICGAFSALALILWAITREPMVAIVLAIASDGMAAFPTLLKAWSHPKTETGIIYVFACVSAASTFFAVKYWTFEEYGFAVYLLILNAALSLLIFRDRFST